MTAPQWQLADLVHKCRLARRWSVEALAAHAGLASMVVERVEQGQPVALDVAPRLERALDVSFSAALHELRRPDAPPGAQTTNVFFDPATNRLVGATILRPDLTLLTDTIARECLREHRWLDAVTPATDPFPTWCT